MCLLEADIGIIMNSSSMVEKCQKLGLQVKEDGSISTNPETGPQKTLYHVRDFRTLLQHAYL